MATNIDPNQQQTIEQALSNILGQTTNIANLLRAKEAAELALRGGAPDNIAKSTAKDLLGASGLSINDFRDSLGHFKGYASLIKNLKDSFKTTTANVNSYNKAVKEATASTKKITQAINYSYAIGRGKYVTPTPFQAGRTKAGLWADYLTNTSQLAKKHPVEFDRLKELSTRPSKRYDAYLRLLERKNISPSLVTRMGLGLGRVSSGAALGGGTMGSLAAMGLGAGTMVVGALAAQIARSVGDALKTGLGSAALSLGLQARGAEGWTTGSTMASIYGLRRMGLSTDAAMQAITQGQAMGLGAGEIRSAVAAQQALGISNTMQKAQTLSRRMGWGQDVASYFRSLEPIMRQTKLSMEELSNATEEFAGNLRGAMDSNTIRGLMGRFGDLVRTKAISWGEVANIAMTPQALAPNQQMAFAHFAAMGGYKFKHSTLLGRAYELQRMGPEQMGQSLEAMRAGIRGYLGGRSWSSLTDDEKFIWGSKILEQQGLTGFYKLPQGEEIMNRLMLGTYSKEDKQKWEEAMKSDTTKIAESMHLIQEPLTSINTMLAGWISHLGVKYVGEFAQSTAEKIIGATQDKNVSLNVTTVNNTQNVDVILEAAGRKAIIRSGANNVNKSF